MPESSAASCLSHMSLATNELWSGAMPLLLDGDMKELIHLEVENSE